MLTLSRVHTAASQEQRDHQRLCCWAWTALPSSAHERQSAATQCAALVVRRRRQARATHARGAARCRGVACGGCGPEAPDHRTAEPDPQGCAHSCFPQPRETAADPSTSRQLRRSAKKLLVSSVRDPIQRSPSWSACANSDQNKPKINARFATRSRWVRSPVDDACPLADRTVLPLARRSAPRLSSSRNTCSRSRSNSRKKSLGNPRCSEYSERLLALVTPLTKPLFLTGRRPSTRSNGRCAISRSQRPKRASSSTKSLRACIVCR